MKNFSIIKKMKPGVMAFIMLSCIAWPGCSQRSTTAGASTVIVLNPDELFHYSGTNPDPGVRSNTKDFIASLKEKQEKWGDSLITIIKPTMNAGEKAAIDLIYELNQQKIGKYELGLLTQQEKDLLNVKDLDLNASVRIPVLQAEDSIYNEVHHYFTIEIKAGDSVWYQPVAPEIRTTPQLVSEPITKNLQDAIAGFETMYPGIKKAYIIRGYKNLSPAVFNKILKALHNNQISEYKIETTN